MNLLQTENNFLTSLRWTYYIFSGPPCGIIFSENSENIYLSTGAPKRVSSDSEKHLCVYTSSHKCHSHMWHVDTATGKTLKKRNAC